jgi:hypothetical protein
MILYRHCLPRMPFLWDFPNTSEGRWNRNGQGPTQYLADTPNGAWAEYLRNQGIVNEEQLKGVDRSLWVVILDDEDCAEPSLPNETLRGDPDTYPDCQDEAMRLQGEGVKALRAPSAALLDGAARGWQVVNGGLQPANDADGEVFVLFGARPQAVGWLIVDHGGPPAELLPLVRHRNT